MKTIYKYPLFVGCHVEGITQVVQIPVTWGARPIHVGLDPNNVPCVWCEVESSNTDKENLMLFVVGTGHATPRGARHIGSFVHQPFVWHIYFPHDPTDQE